MSASTVSTRRSSRVRGDVPLALVAALALIAAVAGVLGGRGFRSEPASVARPSAQVLRTSGLQVQVPGGWARSAPAALAGFSHALWLRDEKAKIDAAVGLAPAVSPTLLPAGVRPVGAPSVQQLGAHVAWRYQTETSTGTPAIFFVAPTTGGIATVGCVGARAGASERSCRTLASAVAIAGVQRLELGQDAAFLSALPTVVRTLNTARDKGLHALTAATSHTAQANAAGDLIRSYRSAAAALAPLTNGEAKPRAAVGALGTTASAYAELAAAARSRSPQVYAHAGGAVAGAERVLDRKITETAEAMRASSAASGRAPVARPSTTPSPTLAAEKPTTTPVSTPTSTPAAATRHAPVQSGGGGRSSLVLFGFIVAVVILVGFGLEIRSVLKEEPTGA